LLVGFIGAEVECDNIVSHLFGDSSSGKTTCAVVAVAMGSKPVFKGCTLMRRYNGTENGLLQILVGNTGLSVVFDEAKAAKIKDFSTFIYTVEGGTEKLRLDKDASIKDVGEYHTSIISTGEYSLTDNSEHATGKEIRLQQFGNIAWTKNATHSETVKRFFRRNYGLPCVIFAQHLLALGKDEVVERFDKHRRIFLKHSKSKDTFSERLSIKYGLILTAVEMAIESMYLNLSYDYILDMLVQNELETANNRDIAQVAYDYVISQVNIHKEHFSQVTIRSQSTTGMDDAKLPDVWGLREFYETPQDISGKKCYETVFVERNQMKKILSTGNFKDIDVIVKKWKERDLLNYESGRNTRFRKMSRNGNKTHLYGLRIFDNPKEV